MSYTQRLTTSPGPGQACIHSGRDSVTFSPAADASKDEVRTSVTNGTRLQSESSAEEEEVKTQRLMSLNGETSHTSIQEVRNQIQVPRPKKLEAHQ